MDYVEYLNIFGVEAKEIPCVIAPGAPTESTVGAVGLLYMDTNTGDIYKCIGVNDKVYTWKPIGGNVGTSFDPAAYGLPVLYLTGDTTDMTKDDAVALDYKYKELSGVATVKWQGSSSIGFPKKNYAIKFDQAFEAATGWGRQNKYCLKANYIDHSHARNIVSAKLWGQIVKKRNNIIPIITSVFDISKITHFINNAGGVIDWVSVSDNRFSIYNTLYIGGYPYAVGQTYDTGDYTISFDIINNTDIPVELIGAGFGVGNNVSEGQWFEFAETRASRHFEFNLTNNVPDAYFYVVPMSSTGSVDLTVSNIKIAKHSAAGIAGLVNGGAVDGFPVIIVLNGEFHGLYTFNIPKDGWMLGMGEGENEAILCADYSEACWFRSEATLNGDFDLEYVSDENNSDWVIPSVNRLINACINSDGTDLDTTIAQYLDWDSAIDYSIFKNLIYGIDIGGKNYILATYDGVKWFFSAYDLDSVFGLYPDGRSFLKANTGPFDTGHTIDALILTHKPAELKRRYNALRADVMSVDNVVNAFTNFIGKIPQPVLIEDVRKWPDIPNSSVNNLSQIIDYYTRRVKLIDAEIIKCTGLDTPPSEPSDNLLDPTSPDWLTGMRCVQSDTPIVSAAERFAVSNYIYFKKGDVLVLHGAHMLYGEGGYAGAAVYYNDKTLVPSKAINMFTWETNGFATHSDGVTTLTLDPAYLNLATNTICNDGYIRLTLSPLSGDTLDMSNIALYRNPNGENAEAWR